jgi:hypothetical protein
VPCVMLHSSATFAGSIGSVTLRPAQRQSSLSEGCRRGIIGESSGYHNYPKL